MALLEEVRREAEVVEREVEGGSIFVGITGVRAGILLPNAVRDSGSWFRL